MQCCCRSVQRGRWRRRRKAGPAVEACASAARRVCAPPRLPDPSAAFLWMLEPAEIDRRRRATPEAPKAAEAAECEAAEPWEATGERCAPHVDFGEARGGELPRRARALLGRGVAFTMSRVGLWPAAEEKWADAAYLEASLAAYEGGVQALANTARGGEARRTKLFTYFKAGEGAAWEKPPVGTVRMRMSDFLRHRGYGEQREVPLLQPAGVAARDVCLYLQSTLLERKDGGAEMHVAPGVGEEMRADVARLNLRRLSQLQAAGDFGQWRVSQLFVGTSAASGARSLIHFDHSDNIFLQICGAKRFRIFPPEEAGRLYAYPCAHPMDRKAQVDLTKTSAQQAAAFPRFAGARSCEVVLRAGEVLFLPAFWWHEVLTEDILPNELCVSVNFWFDVDLEKKLSIPLRPAMRLELSRELEKLVGLVCGTRHTAAFLEALIQQQREVQSGICRVLPNEHPPLGVDSCEWRRLLDFVLWKAALLLGPHHALPFLENLCSPDRFRTCEARR